MIAAVSLRLQQENNRQGSHKPGKPGIVREFCKPGKSRNLRYGPGIFL